MKLRDKFIARNLREQGFSYSEILRNISVAKSTLSLWLRDIDLSPEQQKRLLNGVERGRYVASRNKRDARILITKKIIEESRNKIPLLINNPLFISGLCLYWGEGAKNPSESVKFANSDEKMIKMIMRWLREICLVPESKFRIHVHIHDLHSRSEVEKYWSDITGVPLKQFYKTYIKPSSLGLRRNILYNGTCSIVVSNKELFRKIVGWKLGLQEYFNISS